MLSPCCVNGILLLHSSSEDERTSEDHSTLQSSWRCRDYLPQEGELLTDLPCSTSTIGSPNNPGAAGRRWWCPCRPSPIAIQPWFFEKPAGKDVSIVIRLEMMTTRTELGMCFEDTFIRFTCSVPLFTTQETLGPSPFSLYLDPPGPPGAIKMQSTLIAVKGKKVMLD